MTRVPYPCGLAFRSLPASVRSGGLALLAFWLGFGNSQAQQRTSRAESRSWIETEVQHIVTEEERAVYSRLTTDAEREQFIEDFWRRRDPDPTTADNEFREEFFLRVAYANQHFTAGAPGWRTERGRVHIMHGPPNRRLTFPTGGRYEKPPWQGGDTITAFPFEIWEYNHLPGIGEEVVLEFVDRTSTGQYVLEMDPNRKDVFFWRRGEMPRQRAFGRAADAPLERLSVWSRLQAPPPLRFPALREMVQSRVAFAPLSFRSSASHLRVSDEAHLCLLTLAVRNADLLFSGMGEDFKAEVQLYVQVTNLNRTVVHEFDDLLTARSIGRPTPAMLQGETFYQRLIPLKPGRYKFLIALQDPHGEKATVSEIMLSIPGGERGQLKSSSLVLADVIQKAPDGAAKLDSFTVGGLRILPNVRGYFTTEDLLGLYVEFYDLQVDSASGHPAYELRTYLCDGPQLRRPLEDANQASRAEGATVYFHKGISLEKLEPGNHSVCVVLKDLLAGTSVTARADFKLLALK